MECMLLLLVCLASLHKSIVLLYNLLLLVTTGATKDLGRRDAEQVFVVSRSSPIVSSIDVGLPLPYAQRLL